MTGHIVWPSRRCVMTIAIIVLIIVVILALIVLAMAIRVVKQYERGVMFRFGRLIRTREPGLRVIIPFVDVMHRVSLRIVTQPIQSQGIITLDTTDRINGDIRQILDVTTVDWGVEVTLVELKDIQLPESMKRAMAKQAEAEREKRAKIIAAEGEALAAGELASASDIMMAHPLALQLRNLQTLIEISVEKNSTIVFPAPLMSTIQELSAFLARETKAAAAEASAAAPTAAAAPPAIQAAPTKAA